MNGKIFTLRNLYQSGTEKLEKAGIREAKLDAWYLLEYKTGISRAVFLADPDREVEEEIFRKRKQNGIGNIWKSVHEEFHFSILPVNRNSWD